MGQYADKLKRGVNQLEAKTIEYKIANIKAKSLKRLFCVVAPES